MAEDNDLVRRRDGLMIICDLLDSMQEPSRLTHVLFRTNLSYAQIKKYLDMLVQMGLIQEVQEPYAGFQITERGRLFAQILASHPRKRPALKMSAVM